VLIRLGADPRRIRRVLHDGTDVEQPDGAWVTGW